MREFSAMDENIIDEFIKRTDIKVDLKDYIYFISENFSLGSVKSFKILTEGYEDLNVYVKTNNGEFVIKTFAKSKRLFQIKDNIKGLIDFQKAGIPVTELIQNSEGKYLYKTECRFGFNYVCVMRFVEGDSFESKLASIDELIQFVNFISRIHSLNFHIKPTYDSWSPSNLIQEFKYKKKCLSKADLRLVYPIVKEFKLINFSILTKSIIHGTLEKKHFIKDIDNNYTILDLGCLNYDYRLTDLSVFIAQFVFDYSLNDIEILERLKIVISEYNKISKLTDYELEVLPIFIKATFVSYFITSNYLFASDNSLQTQEWLDWSRKGIEISLRLF